MCHAAQKKKEDMAVSSPPHGEAGQNQTSSERGCSELCNTKEDWRLAGGSDYEKTGSLAEARVIGCVGAGGEKKQLLT